MIIVEVLFVLVMHTNVPVSVEDEIKRRIYVRIDLDCGMSVHRRCIEKVGNYCGCQETVLALYEKWRETVRIDS